MSLVLETVILIIVSALLGLISYVSYKARDIVKPDQEYIKNLCKNGIDIPIKQGQFFGNKLLGLIPPEDTLVHVKLNC